MIRRFSPLLHLVSEGATHNKESKDDREIQKHTTSWSCRTSPEEGTHPEAARRALWRGAHHSVQQLESLRRGAYPQTIQKLATALRVAPEELLRTKNTRR